MIEKSSLVYKALKYVQDVIDKGIFDQLPGSSNILLEVIMDFFTSFSLNQDR